MIAGGTYENKQFRYIVMVAGECNLADMRARLGRFSLPTFVRIAFQTLQGVHDFNLYHYIHQNINPKCFVIGRGKHSKIIYITDFSHAHKRNTLDGKRYETSDFQKNPVMRKKTHIMDVKFMPRQSHLWTWLYAPNGDIESWLYTLIWLYDPDMLPWKIQASEREIYHFKQRLVTGYCKLEFLN